MSSTWKQVPVEEAMRHPLYGVGGWLWVFVASVLFGMVSSWVSTAAVLDSYGVGLGAVIDGSGEAATYLKISLFGGTAIALTVLALLALASPAFPALTITVILMSWPLGVGFRFAAGVSNTQDEIGAFASWLVAVCIWVPYLVRSKRVNVTYKHLIKVEDIPIRLPNQVVDASAVATADQTLPAPSTAQPAVPSPSDDEGCEDCWASAYAELKGGDRRAGVWARSFASANGDETQAEVIYLKARVSALHGDHVARKASSHAGNDVRVNPARAS